jgi:predicted acetyltransferase
MEYKSASISEIDQVVQLSIATFKPNMREQFRLLFSKQNVEHMMIAKDQDQVVSEVNYYPSKIIIPHAMFNVASIGSVCTDQHYRGQGIASRLLILAEEQMLNENITLAIISGDLGIYERFGARDVGHMHLYQTHVHHQERKHQYRLKPYESSDLEVMFNLYSKEVIRYHRSLHEFQELLLGQTSPDTYCQYPIYMVYEQQIPIGYIILSVYVEEDLIKIKEFAGDRKAVVNVIQDVLHLHHKTKITWVVPPTDPMHEQSQYLSYSIITQKATLKIIHVGQFFESIMRYIHHLFQNVVILESTQVDIKLKVEGQIIVLNHDDTLNMVFNGKTKLRNRHVLRFVKSCFPLPMPWSHNLNYQ